MNIEPESDADTRIEDRTKDAYPRVSLLFTEEEVASISEKDWDDILFGPCW